MALDVGTILGLSSFATEPIDVTVTNREGTMSLGDVVQFDILQADASTTSSAPGDQSTTTVASTVEKDYLGISALNVVIVPNTAELSYGVFGVVIDLLGNAGGVDLNLLVRVIGDIDTAEFPSGVTTDGNVTVGLGLTVTTSKTLVPQVAADKIVAIAKETDVGTVGQVWFNGLTGFGHGV